MLFGKRPEIKGKCAIRRWLRFNYDDRLSTVKFEPMQEDKGFSLLGSGGLGGVDPLPPASGTSSWGVRTPPPSKCHLCLGGRPAPPSKWRKLLGGQPPCSCSTDVNCKTLCSSLYWPAISLFGKWPVNFGKDKPILGNDPRLVIFWKPLLHCQKLLVIVRNITVIFCDKWLIPFEIWLVIY